MYTFDIENHKIAGSSPVLSNARDMRTYSFTSSISNTDDAPSINVIEM